MGSSAKGGTRTPGYGKQGRSIPGGGQVGSFAEGQRLRSPISG